MRNNYQQHLAFSFGMPCWSISTKKLNTFNEVYAAAQQFGSTLGTTSQRAVRQDLLQVLDSVFSDFQAQSSDKYEIRFLLELKIACNRLLDEELTGYVMPPHTGCVDFNNEQVRRDAVQMQRDRYFLGCLPEAAVSEILALANQELDRFRANVVAGRLKREDLSVNSGSTVSAIIAVLNREFNALGVLDAVSAYRKHKTKIGGLALELSVPQSTWWRNTIPGLDRAPQTLYAHLDESMFVPKSIVYLSDVSDQNGPTGFYPGCYEAMHLNPFQEIIGRIVGTVGTQFDSPLRNYYARQYHQSMGSENFRRHFMKLPDSLRFNSHLGWDVLPDSELESRLASSEVKMTGLAGTFIAFDGARLLHRGGLIQEGERIVLQVIFSDVMSVQQRVAKKIKRVLS